MPAGGPTLLAASSGLRVENETEVAGGVGTDQRGAVHHAGKVFESLSEFDVVDDCVDLRKGAEDLIGSQAGFEGGVAFGIERFGMGHAACHPENDDSVG